MFLDSVEQVKELETYVFSQGSMVFLNEKLLSQIVRCFPNLRIRTITVDLGYGFLNRSRSRRKIHLYPHMKGQQNAPQETEIESYVVGGIKQDVGANTFAGFKL